MAAKNWDAVLDYVFGHEGGYVNNPKDPGGPTKYGITQRTLAAFRGRAVSAVDVQRLQKDEATAILTKQYAAPIRFNDLPAGLDYAAFDFAVNSGPAQAAKTLQRLVGVEADGIVGLKTLEAIRKRDTVSLIEQYLDARLAFMKKLKGWATFGRGWESRVKTVRDTAVAMARNSMTDAIPPGEAGLPVASPLLTESTAKALPTDAKLMSTTAGNNGVWTAAAGVLAVVIQVGEQAAPYLAEYSAVPVVKYVLLAVTIGGVVRNVMLQQTRIDRGQASV